MSAIVVVLGLGVAAACSAIMFLLAGVTGGEVFGPGYALGILTGAVFGIIARDWRIIR